MAGGQERVLRRRIKSIQSTQKITRAQELIAASRIVRAQGRVHAAQPYSDSITEVVSDLASGGGISSALLVPRPEVRNITHIVIAADRGLCGAYNSNVLRTAEAAIAEDRAAGRGYTLVTSGRKAEAYFSYRDYEIAAASSGFSDQPTYEDARPIGEAATRRFLAEEADLVEIIYTRFVSAGIQVVERQTLVPMVRPEVSTAAGRVPASYEFEPSPDSILDL